ncbi:MAG: pilus assembly protein N-terminal domain-containing protein [Bryobacteraceae bacterium]
MRKIIACLFLSSFVALHAQLPPIPSHRLPIRLDLKNFAAPAASQTAAPASPSISTVSVMVNKSVVLENSAGVKRISITNSDIAEAVAASTTEVLVNGKAPGDTTLILWDQTGKRTMFDVQVLPNDHKLEMVREQLAAELPGQDVSIAFEGGTALLKGTVNDLVSADRAMSIASTLGKVTNLLNVLVPPSEPQVLLKVKFVDIDRTALSQFGANFFSGGSSIMPGSASTGQFGGAPSYDFTQTPPVLTLPDPLNIFIFRNDLNFGAYFQALQSKNLAQILAEPNLLTISGREANFLAGGEFPFPMLQGGGGGIGQITIQFKEFGVRLKFRPIVTPRGTIHLFVNPEVSALDATNGLTVQGYTIPGLDTRRVKTEVELENGQSFMIAGLLDNRLTETLSKIPGLANIPVLGKLFESRSTQRNNTELMVLVTPEIVKPIEPGQEPNLEMPKPFMKGIPTTPPQNPAAGKAATSLPVIKSVPVEVLKMAMQNDTGGDDPSKSGSPQDSGAQNMQSTPISHN